MNYVEAVLIKYALVFASVFLVLGLIFNVYISTIYWVSASITLLLLFADFLILRNTTLRTTLLLDFVFIFFITWISTYLVMGQRDFSLPLASLYVAVLFGITNGIFRLRVFNKNKKN